MLNMSIFNFNRKQRETVRLVEFTNQFANRSKRSRAYKRKFRALADKIKLFEQYRCEEVTSNSYTYQTFEDFIHHLKGKFPYKVSTLEGIKASLTVILNRAEREGYKINWDFSEWKFQKEERTAVYLTPEEIGKINALLLPHETAMIRDLFLIGCWTGLRFSDYSNLTTKNIVYNTIQLKTMKTGTKVIIPIHWMIKDVITRNDNTFPVLRCSQQNFNKVIKTICRKAGLTNQILIERMEGNKSIKKTLKKYEMVASHTARRSFATNMYLAGVSVAKIMLFTGHTTEAAFFKYIRISKQENARELADHPFFTIQEKRMVS